MFWWTLLLGNSHKVDRPVLWLRFPQISGRCPRWRLSTSCVPHTLFAHIDYIWILDDVLRLHCLLSGKRQGILHVIAQQAIYGIITSVHTWYIYNTTCPFPAYPLSQRAVHLGRASLLFPLENWYLPFSPSLSLISFARCNAVEIQSRRSPDKHVNIDSVASKCYPCLHLPHGEVWVTLHPLYYSWNDRSGTRKNYRT